MINKMYDEDVSRSNFKANKKILYCFVYQEPLLHFHSLATRHFSKYPKKKSTNFIKKNKSLQLDTYIALLRLLPLPKFDCSTNTAFL